MPVNSQPGNDASDEDMDEELGVDSDEEGGIRIDEKIYIPPPPKLVSEFDKTGPRLMIAKIINENFKSYAGKQIIGPFHKCFSSIVGPNGSGKSNVIDSMLFVFGYRASKIRSKKISVLIHNSSEHPNINSCTVSVHFQRIIDKPGANYEVVPNSEFIISRTAFKDNTSYYELNNKKVQFKEIAKLLRSHGVDLDHNRFLILQGEVEQIAMMKPKGQTEHDVGMLEFLEDIIGTVRYKEPLEKLFEKVEALTERRIEKLNRLRVVAQEKEALKEPMQDAVQYLKMENVIIKLNHQSLHCERLGTVKSLEEQEGKKIDLDKDLSDLLEEMTKIKDEKHEKDIMIKEKSKKWDKLQTQKDEATAKFDNIRKTDESLHAELVETNKRRKNNIASVKSEKSKLEELQRVPEKNSKEIEECERMVKLLTGKKEKEEEALNDLMSGLREKTEPLLQERATLEKKLILLRKDVDEAKGALDIAESELQLYISEEGVEKRKFEEIRETLQKTAETLQQREKQLSEFKNKIPLTEKSLKEAENELKDVQSREIQMTEKLRSMRMVVEENRAAMQASHSRNRILDSLMEQKRNGTLPGIYGRLGDLGAIDAKYDVAISTACGALDNIVVDSVNTAQACIQFLRNHDIGRATFIPLEKQQRFWPQCRQKIKTPENVPRLFDLIKVEDENVLPAFYFGLHDTLVANDLDQGTRIAYGPRRFRVVSLKGELIELSGTMSGGGRTVLRGRMGQKVVRNEPSTSDVEKLQVELEEVFEECNRLKARQHPLKDQIQTLSNALKDMTVDREKYRIEVRALREQEPQLQKQLKIQEKRAAETVSDPKKVKQLTQSVEKARKHFEIVQDKSKTVEVEVQRLNKQIDDISGNRVKEQQKKIGSLDKSIEKTKAEICRLQVAIKTAQRNFTKTEQQIINLKDDVVNCEQRIRKIQEEKKVLEEEAKNIINEITDLNEALEERDELTANLKEEINALQARESKMKAVKIDLDQKVSEMNKKIKELERRIPDYTKRIANLKLHDIPGETLEPLKELTDEEVAALNRETVAASLQRAKEKLPSDIPNMQIIADYQQKDQLYLQRVADLEEISAERNKLRDIYESARRRRMQEFLTGFMTITGKLKEMYQMITLGGDAELELVDSLDPFSEGIVFSVRPPKKSWKNISNLSGGEKTLSSLALVFALHHYKPTPLYFMDEIDAALDFKNVSIVANYIKERTKNAQFIVISLRSNMFELADYLVGIYKTYNSTKSITVNLGKYYENNRILPPVQLISKNPYNSQFINKSSTQVPNMQKENQLHIQSTCPAQIENPATPINNHQNNSLNLSDLTCCQTPQKSNTDHRRSVSEDDTGSESKKQPARKKRKT
ncbi:structural maintenance of chromosomes protein 4 [Prorops nasuta]|uniref:structural maintenance of chromosomes protein 4 n=1 Tax=Prorops nasuta TaxID=863751 RepID=UPI0034CEF3C5